MNRKNLLLISLLILGCNFVAIGQASICPPNIDFEFGTYANWNYYHGTVATGPIYTLAASAPVIPTRELLTTGPGLDHYGSFPIVAPGGGSHSLRLGRDTNMKVAERATYYVEIPAGTTIYSLVYHYAAVLENPTGHLPTEMPRFVVSAYDSSTGDTIPCAVYTYVSGGGVPGFSPSPVISTIPGNGFDVTYKPWTFGNIKFPGENGRTVAIEFTANACTLGQHFGYGYLDMSCGLFANVISCGTTTETLTAPPGFSAYQWLDSTTMSTSYGTTQTITVAAPTVPTTYAVIITPFSGYGCPDTLYSRLLPSNLAINPSNDTTICSGNSIILSTGATDIDTPLAYSWTPSTGLSCTTCATPTATPAVTTSYTATVSDPGGCSLSHVFNITVFPTPTPISGSLNACMGSPVTLADGVGGGVWASDNPAAATVGSTGIVTGVTLDTATITYSFGGGLCITSVVVTVNPLPSAITGSVPVCAGSTITLGDATTGGTWSSGSAATATVGSASGVVTGVNILGGSATITYTAATGCPITAIVTVNPISPIAGVTNVCTGLTTALSDAATGGTWASSNAGIATVDASGIVTGVTTLGGTATITYTTVPGCTATTTITVNPLPAPITGNMSICPGTTTALLDATTGGTWSSGSVAIASVITGTGVVTGGVAGVDTITYTLGTGCLITASVTVNPTPPAITGVTSVCTGSATLLSDGITGGTWSSSATAIATAGLTTGVVGGVAALGGTVIITYTSPAGCTRTISVIVNPLPSAITGVEVVCAGLTTTLHDATSGGTWSSSTTTVATIDPSSGVVSGVLPGTSTITYTLATGCITTAIVTVNVTPLPISGGGGCIGGTTLLADATTGGTWSSGTTSVATIGSTTGVVTGVAASGGTTVITYALPTGCHVTTIITLNPLPTLFTVTGGGTFCAGSAGLHVYLSGSQTGVIYQLFVSGTPLSTPVTGTGSSLDFGAETTPGTYTVVATNSTTGCTIPMTGSATITVNPVPPLFVVTGGGSYCSGGAGFHLGLTGSTVGINYQLHNGLFVSPIMAGTGSPLDFGAETLGGTYTVIATNPVTGCTSTMTGSATITVLPLPPLFSVTGGGGYCAGGAGVPVGLGSSTLGITYELFNGPTGIATLAGTGAALSFGFQTVPGTYKIVAFNGATSCTDTMTGSATVIINPLPAAITGPATVCVGATITQADDSLGGTWSSSIPANASINSTSGVVTGGTSSTSTLITYTLPTGCTATRTINVSLSPGPITGPSAVCAGSTISESDGVPAGVWSSSASATATVNSSGLVTGLIAGTASIIYTIPSTGCFTSVPVTVNPLPAAITGATTVCVGLTAILHDASSGGTWSTAITAAPYIATVTPTTGIVTGDIGGAALIFYTLPTGCFTGTTVTVYPSPAAITGPTSVCQNATILLTDAVSGGAWSSGNTAVATISGTGTVYPIAPVSTVITYTLPGNCTATMGVVVNPIAPITGVGIVCQGATTTLSDVTPGGTWSSSATGIATVSGGVVGGVTPGMATITYTTAAGCTTAFTVTVNITPTPITGTASVCAGSSTSLGDGVTGGAWSSGTAGVATVTGTGIVWGAIAGTSTITYALATGCSASIVVTVNPLPAAITGVANVCDGLTTMLHDVTTGGTWSSSSTLLATVGATTGIVRGESPSMVTITYTISLTGCSTSTSLTVNPLPAALTGPASICVGYTTYLDEATPGGTWSSSATSVATVGPGTSVDSIYGVAPGTSVISYTLPTGCVATQMVTVVPVPTVIVGAPMVCVGQFIPLSVPGAPGGTWVTGPASLATVGLTNGILTGVASGTVLISYTIGVGCNVIGSRIVNALSPIFGDSVFCVGQVVTLTDTTEAGEWGSISPTVATAVTASLSTGAVTATGPGTANIEYTLPTGCIATYLITVNPSPAGITGITDVCVDNTTTLSDASTGGTWSSGNTGLAVVDPSGTVTGVGPGPVTISYMLTATGCATSTTVMVNALPDPISGPEFVCPGFSVTLSDVGFGTWSVASSTIATIGATSGMATGLEPGITTVSYTLPVTGCSTSIDFTVEPVPDAITGVAVACLGSTMVLSDMTIGGVWTSGNTTVAPVGLFSGVVSGASLGIATITFTTSFGCTTTRDVTVDPSPAAITGVGAVCPGGTLVLSDITTGGTWSSIPASVATVGSDGLVTGAIAGTATIYYTLGGYCAATAIVTVNPLPGAITGALHVCSIGAGTLIDAATGGLWSSSNAGVGTIVPASGVMTGVSPGTTTVTYTLPTTCAITAVVIVDVMPETISGPTHVCVGSAITLSDSVGGGSWSSSLPGVATVGSVTGVVTGATPGPTVITYAIGACNRNSTVNVFALPGIFSVTGGGSYCAGGTGVTVGLSGSVVGVLYYLYHGATATGTFSGTGASLNFGLQTVPGTYTVVAVSTVTGCSNIMSGSALITTIPTITPSVTLTEAPATSIICAGTTVTFDPVPVSGGLTPVYQWKVNGVDVAATGTYSFIPADGDVVTVDMTSDVLCPSPAVVSASVTMTVHAPALPGISIVSSPGDTVCGGTTVTLTALPLFGGSSPTFVWTKNGGSAGVDPSFSFMPANGDVLYCTMTSDYICRLADTARSSNVVMAVDTPLTPAVTITANPGTDIGIGMFDTLTASVANGGPSPSYQWYLNGLPVAGATTNTFLSNNFTYPKEDSVSCEVIADNACRISSFQWLYINVSRLGVNQAFTGNSDIVVVPNPNKGAFTVKGTLGTASDKEVYLEITDMLGQVVYKNSVVAHSGTLNEHISLPNTIANGMYLLNVHSETGNEVFHIVVEQ